MGKIEIFNRTEKYLVVNSVDFGGNKLTIPPVSSGRGSGAIDDEHRDDPGILELIARKEITVRKVPEKKAAAKKTATKARPSVKKPAKKKPAKNPTKKATAKKKPAKKRVVGKNPHKPVVDKDTGKPVIMTARGSTKRVGTVHSAEDAFVDPAKGDEGEEYSDAFIKV